MTEPVPVIDCWSPIVPSGEIIERVASASLASSTSSKWLVDLGVGSDAAVP